VNRYSYGSFSFEWVFEEASIKTHTITVEKDKPVLLRGRLVSEDQQREIIGRRVRWIRNKLVAMAQINPSDIVSGSRLKYLGRSYMVMIELASHFRGASVAFNGSRFTITVDPDSHDQQESIQRAIERFYRSKAEERLAQRIVFWENKTGLKSSGVRIFKFPARWASCSEDQALEFHPRCMELAPKVLDYVIVHELVHTVERSHSKQFWRLVETHFPEWEACHDRLEWDV